MELNFYQLSKMLKLKKSYTLSNQMFCIKKDSHLLTLALLQLISFSFTLL